MRQLVGSYFSILRIVLQGRSSPKILIASILSFTFSITVILCTFGLMDGFDYLLKSGLRHSSGDIFISKREGFFRLTDNLKKKISLSGAQVTAPLIQTEGFAVSQNQSKGVLIRGIDGESFSAATGISVHVYTGGIVLGKELARQLSLKIGDNLALTMGAGNELSSKLPMVQTFEVTGIVEHGIYAKDLRFVYLNLIELSEILNSKGKINSLVISNNRNNELLRDLDQVEETQKRLEEKLGKDYLVKPFWREFDFLFEAVKVEKFSITIILQMIVVVAIFNIISFVIYIMEKKAQEFFFLRAIGLSLKKLNRFWLISVFIVWGVSSLGAFFLSIIFDWLLKNLSFLQIPGEIYVLSSLDLKLDIQAYLTVYGISLGWILLAALIGYLRLKRRPIIHGLRQEFS